MMNEKSKNKLIDDITDSIVTRDFSVKKYYDYDGFFTYALQNDRFTFRLPKDWDDPMEDFLSRLRNPQKNYEFQPIEVINNLSPITENIYAMSTIRKNNECDGMWRNFAGMDSKGRYGVLVHFSVKNIIRSIVKYIIDNKFLKYNESSLIQDQISKNIFVEQVKYSTDEEIAEFFKEITKLNDNTDFNEVAIRSLLKKRKEYEYENEYRILIRQDLLNIPKKEYLQIGSFKDSIEKVILSPHLDKCQVTNYKECIEKNNSEFKIKIEQSILYNVEHFKKIYNL